MYYNHQQAVLDVIITEMVECLCVIYWFLILKKDKNEKINQGHRGF